MSDELSAAGAWIYVRRGNVFVRSPSAPDPAVFTGQEACRMLLTHAGLLAACEDEAQCTRNELEGMPCEAGRESGGVSHACRHCRLTARLNRLERVIAKATAKERPCTPA